MQSSVRSFPALAGMVVASVMVTSAAAAPMVNASLVVRNDALAWGQRLDTLLPATSASRLRTVPAQETPQPKASAALSATTAAPGVPVMSRPITGVVVMPGAPVPVQAAPATPVQAPVVMPAPLPQETGWMRSLQSWILTVARSIGQ